MKKFNLFKAFLLKEKVFWARTFGMHEKFGWIGKLTVFPLALILISIAHYAFAFMHNAFESYLYFRDRKRFNINLDKMRIQLNVG